MGIHTKRFFIFGDAAVGANMGHPSREEGLPFVHAISNSDDFPKAKATAPESVIFSDPPRGCTIRRIPEPAGG
jgi:hypothetical protein